MWPDAGIGVATGQDSGLVVLDVDEGGEESLADFTLPPTLEARTGSGRPHLYFEYPPAGEIGRKPRFRPGLDLLGDDGYVIVPPSRHRAGGQYRWENRNRPAPIPAELLQAAHTGNGRTSAAGDWAALGGKFPEGTRNASLTSIAGTMQRKGLPRSAIEAALLATNRDRCLPPLPEDEVRAIVASVARYEPADPIQPARRNLSPIGDIPTPEITPTDTGNATRLVNRHGDRLRYIPLWGRWLAWEEPRWIVDHRGVHVHELAKDVGHEIKAEAAKEPDGDKAKRIFAFGIRSLGATSIRNMVELARGIEGIPLDHETLDADPWLLGVENGVIDLRSGTLRPADPADYMTRLAPIVWDPVATAPRWGQALEEWFPDPELRAYVQRVAGAALVGAQHEHTLIVHYGTGRNGKGTFVRALQYVLGPYGVVIHLSLLVETRHREHDTVKARLFRARLAVASETQRRVKLDEASVKNLTGGDRITARRMREDPWEFDPSHALWLQTNYLPEISGRDTGIWSRIRVVKWDSTFTGTEADPNLDEKLQAEAPGILRWLVDGCLAWQEQGLAEPESVIRETLAYRDAEDTFARFAEDSGLVFQAGLTVDAAELQEMLQRWASEEGVRPPRGLPDWLREKGARQDREWIKDADGKRKQRRVWKSVGLDDGSHEDRQADAFA
jgi:putative DNA primase/helicase